MRDTQTPADNMQGTGITFADARKAVESMNLIDGFLFDSSIEDEEDAKVVIGAILRTVFDREISDIYVTSQKQFQAIDTRYHGIRFDAFVTEEDDGKVRVTVYDVEMENRPADKTALPRRLRYYNSVTDNRLLEASGRYDTLPSFISVTILSYDPFDAGDMYYEASTILTTHPGIKYDDGVTHIFLYCNGKVNESLSPEHGKRLMEVLKYIVSGEKISPSNPEVNDIDTVVTKIKKRSEVTRKYMKQWDRERLLVYEAKVEGKAEGKAEGKEQTLIDQICKKLLKGKSTEEIATEIEDDSEEFTKEISDIAEKYLPDYDVEKIYEEWKQLSGVQNS